MIPGVLASDSHIVTWVCHAVLLAFLVVASCDRTNMKHRSGEAVQKANPGRKINNSARTCHRVRRREATCNHRKILAEVVVVGGHQGLQTAL